MSKNKQYKLGFFQSHLSIVRILTIYTKNMPISEIRTMIMAEIKSTGVENININERNYENNTALILLVDRGDISLLQEVLNIFKNTINLLLKNNEGCSALDLAVLKIILNA